MNKHKHFNILGHNESVTLIIKNEVTNRLKFLLLPWYNGSRLILSPNTKSHINSDHIKRMITITSNHIKRLSL
jgi:hypothetical protein